MPTVPQTQGIPSTRVSQIQGGAPAEAFGGGSAGQAISQGFQQVAAQASGLVEVVRNNAINAQATEYYAKIAKKKQELFYDPKAGVVTRKGKDSFSALDDYGKQFDEYADSLEKDLSGEALDIARKVRAKERSEFDGQIMRHTSQEAQTYHESEVKAGIEVARNDAVLAAGDPEAIQQKIGLQKSIYMQTASGKPPAQIELDLKEIASKTHRDVIDRLVDSGRDLDAQRYFEKIKGELSGADVDDVEKAVKEGTLAGESQRQSDAIFSSTRSLSAALDETRKIEEPKLRDETTRRVKELYAQKKMAEQDMEERNHKVAGNIIDQTGSIDKIPKAVWSSFSVSKKEELKSYAKKKREGIEPSTDWNEYINLKTMAAYPELRNDFMRMNLMDYRNKLSDTEFKELVNAQSGLRTGDEKTKSELDGYRQDDEIVNSTLKGMGFDLTTKNADTISRMNSFKAQVNLRLFNLARETGKKPTSIDTQRIVDELSIYSVTEQGFIRNTRKFNFEREAGEKYDVQSIDDVPKLERTKIEQALRAAGQPVTDEKVINLFLRKANK